MMCDAVGGMWLATARCCWQLGGEVDHAQPCWTLPLRCHRHDGDLPSKEAGRLGERWMRCQNARWLGLWGERATPATRMLPWLPGNQGKMQVPAPDDDIKRPVVPRCTSLAHDATLPCHPHDLWPRAESFLGQLQDRGNPVGHGRGDLR